MFLAESADGIAALLWVAIIIVGVLIAICSVFGFGATIYLWISYIKFNGKKNKAGINGEDAARKVLEIEGVEGIKVVRAGLWATMTVGNSYSHMFKRIRVRRRLWRRESITALAIGAEKGYLAVLDKEGDPDMRRRNKLIPIVAMGPFAFILMILLGVFLDFAFFKGTGVVSLIASILGAIFYGYLFALSFTVLRVEKKAQERTIKELTAAGLIDNAEAEDFRKLYGLYNLNYVVDTVLAFLETLLRVLQIALKIVEKTKKK